MKKAALRILDRIYGNEPRARRVPFGPIAGSYLYTKPSLSLRMWLGLDEPGLARLARRLLRPGDVVYDVGAHIGYTTVMFARIVGETGAVHAFELLPGTARMVRRSCDLNGLTQCTVHDVGLSDSERCWRIGVNPQGMGTSEFRREEDYEGPSEICRILPLDRYRETVPMPLPALIKIDVEGAEIRTLAGAAGTLRESEAFLIVEFHTKQLLLDGRELLEKAGYRVASLTGSPMARQEIEAQRSFYGSVLAYRPDRDSHRERLATGG